MALPCSHPQQVLHDFIGHELPPNLAPDSQLSFARIRGWLEDCDRNHASCRAARPTFMPKRVIEISSNTDADADSDASAAPIRARLVRDEKVAPYIALSYCWGGDQPAKTTNALLPAYERDIPLHTLPQTIRDALTVTHAIGFRYLWVDAMAIIQDDGPDKVDQIAQMHNIYRGASLTLAAAAAATSRDGFLRPRTQHRPSLLAARTDDSTFGQVLVAPMPQHALPLPLYTRAWTFQENQLATRTLAYGPREPVFQCLEAAHRDGGHSGVLAQVDAGGTSERDAAVQLLRHQDPGSRRLGVDPGAGIKHPRAWGRVVAAYTQRALTVAADKLPAVAAIAEEYARTSPVSDYLAGLWREELLVQCLWAVALQPLPGEVVANSNNRGGEAEYRAPSWSWAALDAHVVPSDADSRAVLTAALLHAETTLRRGEVSRFGMVAAGHLRLRCRVARAVWSNTGLRGGGAGRAVADSPAMWPDSYGLDERLTFSVDDHGLWPAGEEVAFWCAEVCSYLDGRKASGEGLLLVEVVGEARRLALPGGGGAVFRRAGKAYFRSGYDRPYWFDDEKLGVEWREVVVV
ncbi:heterokaryon incompatibility protein-domain-containing protein [Lasiosphaeria ovina]|uniref:Heterokaryon incompatibility protein-domain-containing protein n=1 Tax=Lasiosphaeria ovina TaxID=92902 RepID=A0AAE0KGG9_9PEZI|nr:heterokaryon incompatibility protein-domain-containing protein [Lasiosphaeria ovina]